MHRPLFQTFRPIGAGHEPPGATVSLRGIARLLIGVTAFVILVCLAATIIREALGVQHGPLNIIPMLDLDAEATFPAWYSSILLFIAAALLCWIGWTKLGRGEAFAKHWLVMGIIFVLLSADECVAFHERVAWPIRRIFEPQGIFYFGWVIPALVFVCLFVLAYIRFLIHLNPRSRWMFVLAGAIFVGGALGVEMAAGAVEAHYGTNQTMTYVLLVTIEEVMEIVGIALFVFALLDHVQREWGGISLIFAQQPPIITEVPSALPQQDPAAAPAAAPARPAVASPR